MHHNNNKNEISAGDSEEVRITAEQLVHHYGGLVKGMCLSMTGNLHAAEDAMQETFMKAIDKIDTLHDPTKARNWLVQIARRSCIDASRRRKYQTLERELEAPPNGISVEKQLRITRLYNAIVKLHEDYRRVIYLYYLDGKRCKQVAEILELSETTVRQRLVRGRLKLHTLLTENKS